LLRAAKVRVALQLRDRVAGARVGFRLPVRRVGGGPPPGRLDRATPVRSDDEVDTLLVKALPELPPGRGAAVAEVEVDRRRDREDIRGTHDRKVSQRPVTAPLGRLRVPGGWSVRALAGE